MTNTLDVADVAVSVLIPYANNPRINDGAVDAVAASIVEFGFRQPIVVDEDMVVLVGHTRLKAAKQLGLPTVPVHVARGLTDAQKRAYRIADNKTNELAEWDEAMLAVELEALRMADFDLGVLGFEDGEIDPLLSGTDGQEDEGDGETEGTYSKKVQVPIYEPKGEIYQVSDLFDARKAQELKADIDAAVLTDDVRDFLHAAADRHTVFHFRRIAEYYAHASPDVQRLMEKSALVIIDFNQAIENGFVALTEKLGKIADVEEGVTHA